MTTTQEQVSVPKQLLEDAESAINELGRVAQLGFNNQHAQTLRRIHYALTGDCYECLNRKVVEYAEQDGPDSFNMVNEPCPVCSA